MKANAEANVGHEEVADFNKPLDHPVEGQGPTFEDASHAEALLGARPDLSYKGPPTATCKCLAVAVGQPGDASFHWGGERPRTNPDSELVIAVTSSGIACPEAGAGALGASYWGYEVKGSDVVVVIEPAAPGRPQTTGAIIPRPLGGGQVFVRPADKKVPYGRALSGAGAKCSVGQLGMGQAPSETSSAPATKSNTGVRIHTDEAPPDSTEFTAPGTP